MKNVVLLLLVLLGTWALAAEQQAGSQAVRGTGTINQMSVTPDVNQQLTGQTPLTNTGGQVGDAPDNTDRVNGKAFPTGSGVQTGAQAVATALDPRSGTPVSDATRLKAAQQAAAGAKRPNLNPSLDSSKAMTPSPGEKATTRLSTGGQTNEKKK